MVKKIFGALSLLVLLFVAFVFIYWSMGDSRVELETESTMCVSKKAPFNGERKMYCLKK